MKITITENDRRVCVEVTGNVVNIETVIENLRKGLEKAGYDASCMSSADDIKANLNEWGEWDNTIRDAYTDEHGKLVDSGVISYENITASCVDGMYNYGCVVLVKSYHQKKEIAA